MTGAGPDPHQDHRLGRKPVNRVVNSQSQVIVHQPDPCVLGNLVTHGHQLPGPATQSQHQGRGGPGGQVVQVLDEHLGQKGYLQGFLSANILNGWVNDGLSVPTRQILTSPGIVEAANVNATMSGVAAGTRCLTSDKRKFGCGALLRPKIRACAARFQRIIHGAGGRSHVR